ncbi:hypothetical protein CRUP_015436 [Coryphaenoides rupestris]|nr:hypothetical protein CRUP_015436 [Coryphaenoides rupestris]
MPLAVTALLPVVLFPMMGIMKAGDVCVEYLKDSNMLFIGGLLVAIAVEECKLHTRIALRVLLVVGVKPALLMMGFMIVSAFLSMWISNTATTAMMLPIAQAVLQQLSATEAQADERELRASTAATDPGVDNQGFDMDVKHRYRQEQAGEKAGDVVKMSLDNGMSPATDHNNHVETELDSTLERMRVQRDQKYVSLTKGMCLSVCYAASIGGTATLTGTTPNLILKGQVDDWFGFAFPNMIIMLVLSWLWLQLLFLGVNDRDKEAYGVMRQEYLKLGRICFAEVAVLIVFITLVALWFTREPGFMDGWATVLFNQEGEFVTDGTIAIFMSMLFFVIPNQLPRFGSYGMVHERMPWNIVLLLGGGFALAKGSEKSGLSIWLGESLAPLESIPAAGISILLCLLVATFTECSSNTATTTLFLPILASMVKAGFMLNIIGILSINVGINTWGKAMFNLGEFPEWANMTKS